MTEVKGRVAAAIGLAIAASLITGCGDTSTAREPQMTRDELFQVCIEAGGSFEYNGSLPYWQCVMPGGHTE